MNTTHLLFAETETRSALDPQTDAAYTAIGQINDAIRHLLNVTGALRDADLAQDVRVAILCDVMPLLHAQADTLLGLCRVNP